MKMEKLDVESGTRRQTAESDASCGRCIVENQERAGADTKRSKQKVAPGGETDGPMNQHID